MKRYLITLIGPTGIGKTSLSLQLAKNLHTEILSADSRQFYKEMQIGTAAPTDLELKTVKHHFIRHLSVTNPYDVGDFERDALQKLNELFKKHRAILMVGGSGLYLKAVCEGLNDFPNTDPAIREVLNHQFETEGLVPLQLQLQSLDPEYAKQVDLNNHRRLIRALEVSISSGKPYSYFLNRPKAPRAFIPIKIGLTAKRELIYERIENRVDQMIEEGLVHEVKSLYPFRELPALHTIGYTELFSYLNGECSLETAVAEIKKNTRRFAKRQLTWFKKDNSIKWFSYDTPLNHILSYLKTKIS